MKVLVIDDDPDVVEVVSLTFEMRWPDSTIVSALDGASGIEMVDSESPSLVILDIGLPDMDGYTVCQEIRRFSDVPIIMLTVREKEADIVKGLQLGADDYVGKPFRAIEFMARVQSVLRRAQSSPYAVGEEKPFQHSTLLVDFTKHEVFLGDRQVRLTPTEYQLLYHLTKNAGKVLTHRMLLGRVWGREYLEETNYLKVHIKHLRQKLEDDPSEPRYILTERTVGYKFAKAEAAPQR
jgi:two-component system, OmpR family, KDP operon response regulator KdpE